MKKIVKQGEFKDGSNKRIMEELVPTIMEYMKKEGRGFIFAPVCQEKGDHSTLAVATFSTEHRSAEFWATIAGLIDNVSRHIPEDDYEDFKKGFMAMVALVCQENFPSIRPKTN